VMACGLGSIVDRLLDRARALGMLFALTCLVSGFAADSARATGEVTYDQCFGTSPGCIFLAGAPLKDARSVAVSPNDKSVYVAASGGGLSHFFVGVKGGLAYDGCVSDDGSGGACLDVPGSESQFLNPDGVVVSPNSASVYTSTEDGTVAHLFAAAQGQLSWDGCVSNDGSGGLCADVPGNGNPLELPLAVAVSPGGSSVYTAAITNDVDNTSTVSHLFANPSQGQLSWDGCVSGDGSGGTCLDVPGDGSPLADVTSIAVSPNAASLYAIGDGTVSHLFANVAQGQLSWDGCVSNGGSGGTCADIPGSGKPLSAGKSVVVSPDGSSVYVVSGGTVSHLFANPDQGQLTWDGCISDDGSGGTCADLPGNGAPLAGADGVAISPDGRSLYVASSTASSLSVFDVGPQGRLTFKQCLSDNAIAGCTDPPGDSLDGASAVAVSPDGGSVYVAGDVNGTLAHFFRATASGGGSTLHTATATIGNQRVTLSSALPSSCLAKGSSLTANLSSSALTGSNSSHLSFAHADLYLDRGVRHVHHKIRHSHGKRIVVTTITYTPNQTRRQQPMSVSYKLSKLSSGSHTLRVKVFFHKSVAQHGHRRTETVSTSLQIKFSVC
jgi:DNA-binding beta-propeller fold protein YncE